MNDTTDNEEPNHITEREPDEAVAILQYPVPMWVKNLGTTPGAIFGDSNEGSPLRRWRESLPAGKWHIGERDGGFVRLHLELVGFRDRQMGEDDRRLRESGEIDQKPEECVALAAVIGATQALGWLEGYLTEGNRYTVRIRHGHVLVGRGPDLVRSTERFLRPSAALAWLCSPADMPERTSLDPRVGPHLWEHQAGPVYRVLLDGNDDRPDWPDFMLEEVIELRGANAVRGKCGTFIVDADAWEDRDIRLALAGSQISGGIVAVAWPEVVEAVKHVSVRYPKTPLEVWAVVASVMKGGTVEPIDVATAILAGASGDNFVDGLTIAEAEAATEALSPGSGSKLADAIAKLAE